MGSNGMVGGGSPTLMDLARQLRRSHEDPDSLKDSPAAITGPAVEDAAEGAVRVKTPPRAAVLVCLFEDDTGQLRVFLTRRSSLLSADPGEVSLPGGKVEEGDAGDIETATREAKEEIGLDPSLVDVVSVLEPIQTKKGMVVVPVIGLLYDRKAFTPILNAAEVEAIFDVPLEMFLRDENRRAEEREWKGEKYLLHFFDYEVGDKKYVIWALTARILIRTASAVYKRPPAFQEKAPTFGGRSRGSKEEIR